MKKLGIAVVLIGAIVALVIITNKKDSEFEGPPPRYTEVVDEVTEEPASEPEPEPVVEPPIVETPVVKKPSPKPQSPPVKPVVKKPAPTPEPIFKAPQVELHEELIPENIEIVRVYYSQPLIGPGTELHFDINGSGFTKSFEKMISVKSGNPDVTVSKFRLITPNQIRGSLVIDKKAQTTVNFPQVLIQDKVVFQAPEPYGVIREGEVLNLIFIEMEESGRAGKFRVFTNLTQDLYRQFKITASTPGIQVTDLKANLPFTIDGKLIIGWQVSMGNFDLFVNVKDKIVWEGKNIIRIVRPNVGQSGLAQRLKTVDGFHRPGDEANFEIQGSGFRPIDSSALSIKVDGIENIKSSFTYIAPGRMGLSLKIPKKAKVQNYSVAIFQDETQLLKTRKAFRVVGKNWVRDLKLEPSLFPGGESQLILRGRSLSKKFIKSIQTEVDDKNLDVSSFVFESSQRAVAKIRATGSLRPGDYWLKMTAGGESVKPQFGSIVRVQPKP